MGKSAELEIDNQINWVDSFLMFNTQTNEVMNPFIGLSNGVMLKEIRKSLVEYKKVKEGDKTDGQ